MEKTQRERKMIMAGFVYLVALVIVIWIDWYLAKQFYEAAKAKGHYEKRYFWICFLLTWAGYLLVIALPDRGNQNPVISDELPDL